MRNSLLIPAFTGALLLTAKRSGKISTSTSRRGQTSRGVFVQHRTYLNHQGSSACTAGTSERTVTSERQAKLGGDCTEYFQTHRTGITGSFQGRGLKTACWPGFIDQTTHDGATRLLQFSLPSLPGMCGLLRVRAPPALTRDPLLTRHSQRTAPTSGVQNTCSGMFPALFQKTLHPSSGKSTPVCLFIHSIFKVHFSPDE